MLRLLLELMLLGLRLLLLRGGLGLGAAHHQSIEALVDRRVAIDDSI
jgi:hypothetical protein